MNDRRDNIRNIAIIAHVDHGKTTLVDAMLKQTGGFNVKADETREVVLDSNPLERERGITILAKCTSVVYKGKTINIVDTPGHADFGSEVERILQMVDGALLLVDAVDGPMPQTRFVLRKAMALGLSPIVVINKMDRQGAKPHHVHDAVLGLFIDLGASDPQLEFPVVYASGREGRAGTHAETLSGDLAPLFETILHHVPPPLARIDKPLQMLVTMLDYSSFVGQIGIGRIMSGVLRKAQQALLLKPDGTSKLCKVNKIEHFAGLSRKEADDALAGDIVAVAGLEGVDVGDTLCDPASPGAIVPTAIDEPTISMEFMVNDSPFAGLEGKFVTGRHLKARLEQEARTNVGLRLEQLPGEGKFKVSGRGELHLTILIETMRREGYEMAVSSPEVIFREENGRVMEPVERLVLDIPAENQGAVYESVGKRAARLENMINEGKERVRMEYILPSRALFGFKSEFMTATRGNGIMHHSFHGYAPRSGGVMTRQNGVFIAKAAGETTSYALYSLQDHGQMFVLPGLKVYEGLIVGQNARGNDLVVNPCKEKHMSNMRSKASDEALALTPHRVMSLEQAIEYVASDELVEVTPKALRLRKKILAKSERKRLYGKTDEE
ncbi:MAG: translational GTPase TypA [bacterium]